MGATRPRFQSEAGRIEAERLIALAIDMLDGKRDQIARDHLGLALNALQTRREHEAEARYCSGIVRSDITTEGATSANDLPDRSTQPADSD